MTEARFVHLSAALTGVKEVRRALEASRLRYTRLGKRDLLFLDEIHRFNRAQQDVLLPFLEEGSILFIGASWRRGASCSSAQRRRTPHSR